MSGRDSPWLRQRRPAGFCSPSTGGDPEWRGGSRTVAATEFRACALVDVQAVDGRHHRPATSRILLLVVRAMAFHYGCRVRSQLRKIVSCERGRCADDEAIEADRWRLFDRQQMGRYDILDVCAAIQKLVQLQVVVVEALSRIAVVILFREEARRPQDQARQAAAILEQLAQMLGGELRCAVDVLWTRRHVFRDPRRRRVRRRHEGATEDARGAGEDERP